jgi:hypothetical protein
MMEKEVTLCTRASSTHRKAQTTDVYNECNHEGEHFGLTCKLISLETKIPSV